MGSRRSDRYGSVTSAGWKRQHGDKDMPSNWRSPPPVPARNRRSRIGRITGETGKSAEGERVAAGSAVAMKRSNVLERRGPALQRLRRKEGKDEMTKASIDLQDLRRRIYVKVKAERLRRFWVNTFVCSGAKGPRLGTMD